MNHRETIKKSLRWRQIERVSRLSLFFALAGATIGQANQVFGAEPKAATADKAAAAKKRCDGPVASADGEELMVWSGACKAGKAFGKGVMTWSLDEKVLREFEGEAQNGAPHGRGTMKYPDGRRFEGEFVAGEAVSGALFFSNGDKFDGVLVKGIPEGNGRVLRANGDAYDAVFKNGVAVGVASYSFGGDRTGGRFIGLVENHFPHGDGTYFNQDGSSFAVRFDRGSVVSFGEFKFANGDRWQGPIRVVRPEGKGVLHLANGDRIDGVLDKEKFAPGAQYFFAKGGVFTGEMVGNVPAGKGVLRLPTGDRIRGVIAGGVFSGVSTLQMADGRRYEGKLENSLPKGGGVLLLPGGERIESEFDGTLDVEGKLKVFYPNGDAYVGETRRYLPNGKGELITRAGHRYAGAFKEGVPHGEQDVVYANGATYRGNFADGERSGSGLMKWPDATRYEGQFSAGIPHGPGALDDGFGLRFKGEFHRGLPGGKGRLDLPSGRAFEGLFTEGVAEGLGSFVLPDHRRVTAKMIDAQPDGVANYTDQTGKPFSFVFTLGVPKSDDGPFFSMFKNKAEELTGLLEAGLFGWGQNYVIKHEKWFEEKQKETEPLIERLRNGLSETQFWKVKYLRNLAMIQSFEVGRFKGASTLTQARTMAESARKPLALIREIPIFRMIRDKYALDPVKDAEPFLGAANLELVIYLISTGRLDDAYRLTGVSALPLTEADKKLLDAGLAEFLMRAPLSASRQMASFDRLLDGRDIPEQSTVITSLMKSRELATADGDTAQVEVINNLLKKVVK